YYDKVRGQTMVRMTVSSGGGGCCRCRGYWEWEQGCFGW
ncbi:hypothetical protein L195_g005511, partial [Trifolium pratense]